MNATADSPAPAADSWLTTRRFALMLALALGTAHFGVLTGRGAWFNFDYGVLGYPFAHFQRECFWRGELPLWNPYSNCGAPFLAQWGTMALYPGALIYLLLPLPWALGFFCLAHLFLGGLGMFRLARRWTGHPFAAAVAGFALVFGGVAQSSLAWPNYTVALGWMPWLVLAAERAWREGGRAVILAALAGAMQMLSGVPEFILLTWLFVLMWFAADAAGSPVPKPRLLLRLGLLITLVAALAAAQLLPFFDLLAQSQRDREFATDKWAMPGWGWANFFVPLFHYLRTPQGDFRQEGQTFFATYYPGLGIVLLAALAVLCVRERRARVLAAAGALGLVLALGENGFLYPWVKQLFPALGVARYPVKFIVLLAFAAPLLAAFALRGLLEKGGANERAGPALFALWFAGVALAGGLLWFVQTHPFTYDQPAATRANTGWRILFLTATFIALRAVPLVKEARFTVALQAAVLALVTLDLLTHLPRMNPAIAPDSFAPGAARQALHLAPPPAPGVARVFITPEAERKLTFSEVVDSQTDFLLKRRALWSNLNVLDAVPKVNGSSTLQIRALAGAQKRLYSGSNAPPAALLDFLGAAHASAPGLPHHWTNRPSARLWISAGQQPAFVDDGESLNRVFDPDFDFQTIALLPVEARSSVQARGASAARVTPLVFSSHRVEFEVESPAPTLAVIAQAHSPSWRAAVDGRPAQLWRANHAFQAVEVPAGRHRVTLVYRERGFGWGSLISGATALICVWLWKRKVISPAASH